MMVYLSQFTKAKLKKGAPLKPTGNPSSVKVYGPGVQSEGLNVGMSSATFTINIDGAGPGKLVILCTGPSGPVKVTASSGGANTYVCSYVPAAEGLYRVEVYFCRVAVPGSPFVAKVSPLLQKTLPLTPSGSNISASGRSPDRQLRSREFTPSGELQAALGLGSELEVSLGDDLSLSASDTLVALPQIYLEAPVNEQALEAWIEAPNGKSSLCAIDRQGDGFKLSFLPHMSGTYYAYIKIPFNIAESQLLNSESPEAISMNLGKPIEWQIKDLIDTKKKLKINVVGPKNSKVSTNKKPDNTYTISFNPAVVGTYLVHVAQGDKSVRGSPFMVKVSNPKEVKLSGPGVKKLGGNIVTDLLALGGLKTTGMIPLADKILWLLDLTKSGLTPLDVTTSISGPENFQQELEVFQKDPNHGTISFVPPKCGAYKLQVQAGGEDIPQSPVDITVYDPTLGVPSFEPEISAEVEEVELLESLPPAELSASLPELSIDASVGDEDSLDAWIKAPNGKILPCNVDKQGDKYKLSFLPFVVGPHQAHISVGDKPIKGSPFQINVTQQQAVSSEGPEVVLMGVGNPLEWKIEGFDGKGKLKVNVVGPKKCKAALKKNADKSHSIVLTPTYPGTYLVHVTDGGKPIRGSPFVVKVTNPKNVKLSGPGVKKLGGNIISGLLSLGGLKFPSVLPFPDNVQWTADLSKAALFTSDLKASITGPEGFHKDLEVVQKDPTHGTINFVPPKCGPYRLQVTAGAQEIPQSPADITIYDPTLGVPSFEPEISAEVEEVELLESLPPAELSANLPELSIDASVGDEDSLDAWIKAPNGKILPCNVDKQGDKYKLSFLPFVVGPHQAHISVGDKPIKGSPFQINVTQQQAVSSEGPEVVLMGVGNPLEWKIEGFDGKGKLKVNVVGPKKCKAALKKNADKSHSIVLTPTYPGTYLVHVTDGGKPIHGSPFVVKVTNPKNVKLSGPGVKKLGGNIISGLLSLGGVKFPSVLPFPDNVQWTADLSKAALFTSDLKASITGPEGFHKDLEVVQKDPTHGTINFVPPKCGPYRLQVTAGAQEIPQSPADITIYDPTLGVPSFEPEISAEVEEVDILESLPSAELSTNLPELSIDASVGDEDSLDAWIKAPNGKILPCNVDKQGDKYKLSFLPFVVGPHQAHISVGDKPIKGSPFQINVTQQQAVSSEGPEVVLMGVGNPLEWKIEGFDGKGKLKVSVVGPKKCKAALKKNADKSHSIVLTPTYPGTYLVHVTDGGKPIRGSPFVVKVTNPKNVKLSGPGVKKLGGNIISGLLSLGGVKFPSVLPFPDNIQWTADLSKAALFTSDLKASITGPEGFHKDLEVVQKDPTHGTINFVPPKCGPYRLQVTAGAQEIPQSPADITIYDPTLGVPSFEPEISAEVEEVDILESLPSAELSTNLPELSIDASVGDEDSLDAWIKAPNGKILPCNVDKQGDKYKLSFLPFVVGPHQAHISVGDKPIKGSPFQINVTQQQAVSSEGPEVVLMGVGNPLEWKIEGFDGKGKLKVSVVGPKKCKAALKKNADKSHSIVLTPTYPGTYLVHVTDGGKPIRGSPFVVKVTNPKNVKLSGPGVKKLGGNIISGLLSLGGVKFPSVLPFPDNIQWTADLSKAALFTSDLKASITGPEGFHKDLEVVQKDPTHGTINFVPPKCGPYRLQVTAGAQEIPQSPADITIYDPTLGVPSFEPEISAEVEEVELLESLPPAELSANLPELSIDASVGDEDSLDAWIKAPNGKILPCNVDKQGDKYKLSFLPFVVGPHQAHISVGDKPIKGSPFQINVTQQQAVSSEGPEVVLMGVGNPLEWKIEGFDGKGKLKVNVVGPKKCKAALKKNADKSHSIVLTPTYPGTYLVHVTDGGKPIRGSPFVVKVTNPKNVKLSGPGVKKLGGNIISGLLSLGGVKFPSVLPFPDNIQWTADLSKAALFTSDLKASITGPEGFHKDLEVVQKDPTHGTINFVPPKCGPYRLQVTAGAQEIPQSPADITIYDPTLGVPSFEPEISAEVEEVDILESLPSAELSTNLPELSIDASVGDEDSLDAWIKAPNGKILPCNVDKQGDKYKLSFLPFVVGPHQAHISVGDKPIKGSPFQINVTQQQAVSSEGPEVVLMGVGNPLEWKIEGFDGKGKLKVSVVGPKKCKAALKKNADKSHSIVLTPTYPGTYLVHVTDGGKPIRGSPFVVKVTNPKNVKLSGPGVKKLGGNIISGLLSLGGVKFPSVLPFPDNIQWTADLSKAALFTSDLKASITGPEGFHKDLEVVQKDPTHGTINFVPPKCGPYRLQVTAGAQEIPQSPADITIYDPTLGVPSFEPEISAEVEEVELLESLPPAELSANLPELSIDASVGDEDSIDAWIKAPNGKILPCNVDKQGDKYKLSFLPFVVGPHQAHISVGDKPIKGSPFQINVTQQQAVSSEGPEVVLMGVGNPLEWKIEGFDGKGKLKVNVVGPKKCKAALKKNADKSHSIVLTPTYPGTYLVHVTDGGKPIRGSPFVVKVTNPKNVKLSGPGVKKLGGNIISGLLSLGGVKFPSVLPFPDNVQWTADLSKAALFTSDLKASITGPEGFHKDLEVVQKDPTHGTINFVPPKCGPYRLQVTAGAQEIPQSPADITIYDPTLGVPSFEPEISAEVEEVELLESLPPAELSANLPELSIDASVGDEDSLDAWIKAPNGKILPCNVDKQGDKYKLSFLPFVVGPHQAHISVGDKPIKGSPFQINVTQQQAVSSEGPEVVLMGVGNPLEWKIEGFDGKGKLKVNVVGPKKCKAALKKNADKSHSIVLTPTYPGTYLVHVTDGGKPIRGSPFVVKVTNPKNVKLSGPGVKKLGGNIISGLLSLGGVKFPSVLPFPDNVQWTADLSKAALFTSDLKASITGPEGFHKDLEVVQKDPTHGTINFVPPKCGPYRLQVTAGTQEIPQSPADITIYDPTLGVPSFEPEISAEVEEVELLESLPPAELSANLPELSIDASVGDEDSLDAWIKAPNGKILPCNVDKQGDKYKLSFLPFVVGPHQAHISVGDKPIKGSPFQINVTQQQAVSSEGPEVVLMGVGNPLEWKIEGFDGKGKLKVNVVGPKKCKAALKKNADKSHSIVLTPTYPGTYLVHVTDGGKPIRGSPFVVKVTNPKNVKLSGPGVKKLGGNIITGLLSLGGLKFPSVLPFPDNVQWTADLSKAALFISDLKASITGPEGFHKDLEVVQKDPTHGTINFVPPKCGPYRLQVTAGAQEIPQSPADITIYDPTLGVPSFEPEISAEVEEVELLESLPPAELSANLPELSIDASVGDEDSLDAWIKAPNGKILPCSVDKQGDKYKLSFLPFVVGPHQAHISVGDKPIKGSPFQINVTQQQAVSSEGPDVVLMGVGNPLEWKIEGFDGKGKLKVSVVGPKKCKAALKKNADKSHSIVLTPTYPGTYLVHLTDGGKPIRGSPFVVKVTNPKNVKLSGPGVKKLGGNIISGLLSLGGVKFPSVLPFPDNVQWTADLSKAALFTSDLKASITGPEGFHKDLEVVQKDPTHGTINFVPPKCGPYRLQVTAGAHEIPQSPADITIYDPTLGVPSFEPEISAEVEEVELLESLPPAELSTNLPELSIDASVGDEDSLDAWIKAPNGKILPCNVDKQGDKYKLSFLPFVVGPHQAHISVGDKPIKGSPFQINVTQQQAVSSEGPEVVLMGVGNPLEWKIEGFDGKGKLKVNVVGPKKCKAALKKNADKSHSIVLTPTYPGTYLVHVTDGGKPIRGSPFVVKVTNPKNVKLSGPGVKKLGGNIISGLLSLGGLRFPSVLPFPDNVQWTADLSKAALFTSDLKASITGPEGFHKDLEVVQKDPTHGTINFVPPKCGPYRLQVTAGAQEIPQSPADITIYDPTLGVPSFEPEISAEVEEVELLESLPPAELSANLPELSIDASVGDEDSLDAWIKAPNGKILPCNVDKQGDKYKLSFLPFVVGPHQAHISVGDKPIKGSPFQINVTQQQAVSSEGPEVVLMGVGNPLEWKIEGFDGKGKLKVNVVGPKKCKAALKKNADKSHSIVLTPTYPGTYLVHVTDGGKPIRGSPFVVKVTNPKNVKLSGPGVKKLGGNIISGLLSLGGLRFPSVLPFPDNVQWTADLSKAALFTSDLKASITGPEGFNKDLEVVQKDPTHGTINFVPPKCGPYRLQVTAGAQEIPQSPADITIYDPTLGVPSFEPEISAEVEEVELLESLPPAELSANLPELSIDASVGDEDSLDAWIKAPNGKILPCNVDKQGDKYKLSFLPFVVGPHQAHISVGDKPIKGSPFQINVTQQQAVSSEGPEVVLMGVGNPLEWKIEGFDGKGKLKVNVVGPKKCKAALKKNADKSHSIVLTPTYPGTYLVHVTDGGKPIRGSPLVVKVTNPKNVKLSGPGVKKLGGNIISGLLSLGGLRFPSVLPFPDNVQWTADLSKAALFTSDLKASITGPEGFHKDLEVVQKDPTHGTINFVPPKCGPYRLQVTAGAQEIPQSPADITIYDPTLGVPSFEPEMSAEVEEVELLESLPPAELSANLPELSIDASVGDEDSLDAWIKAPNGKILPCNVDKQGDKYKLSFLPFVVGPHQAHISVGDKPIKGSPFQINVTQQQAVSSEGPEVVLMGVGNPLEWKIEGFDGKGKLKVNVVGPKKCKAALKKNADKSHSIVLTPTYPGTYLVHVTDGGKPIHGSPFVVKVTNPKNVKLSGPGVKKLGGNIISGLLSLGGLKFPSVLPFPDNVQWTADLSKAALFTSDLKASITGPEGFHKDLEVVQKDPTHGTINFVPPKCGPYRLQVTAGAQEIPQSPADITIYDPTLGVPSLEPEISAEVEEVDILESLPSAELSTNLPELSIDASVGDEDSLDAWIKAPNGKILPCNVDKQGDKYKLSFLPFVVGPHQAHISVGDKPIKGSPFQINVTQQQAVSSEGPEVVLMGVGNPLEWKIEGFDGKGKLKVNVVGPKKCKAALKKNAEKTHSIVLTPTYPGTYLVHVTDGGKPIRGSPFVVKVTNPKNVKLSGPGVTKLGGNIISGLLSLGGLKFPSVLPFPDNVQWTADLSKAALFTSDLKASITGPEGFHKDLEVVQKDPTHGTINFVPPKCGPYRLQVTAGAQEIPQSPADITIYDPTLGVPSLEPEISAEVEEVDILESLPSAELSTNLPELSIDASVGDEDSLDAWIKAPNGKILPCSVDKQGDKYKLSFLPFVVGPHQAHISVGDKPIKGSPFQINVTQQQAVSSEGPEVVLMGVGNPLEWKIEGFDGKGKLKVNVVGPKKCKAALKKNADKSHSIVLTPTYPGTYLVHVTDGGKPIHGSPFVVKVTNPKNVKLSGPGVKKLGGNIISGLLSLGGLKFPSVLPFPDNVQWTADLSKAALFTSDLKASITGPEGFHKDLEVVQKDPTHGTINFVPPKCGPYRLQVTAGAQEIPQSPADITIYDPTLGVPSLEPEISAEVEEVDILESLPSAELSTNLPELSIDASVGDEDSLDAWIKAPNGKILPCNVDKQGDKYKLSFLPFVVGPHQAHISVGDKPIKGSPFQINVTQQQAVSSEGPEVVLMGVGNPLEWKIEGFDGKGKLKVNVVGPKKCKAALKKNAEKTHSIVLTPTYPGTYLVHVTDGGKPIRGSPFVVKVTNPKNVKLSGPGVTKLGGNIISGLLSLGGLKFPSVLPFPDNVQWTADLSKAALFTSDLKASITGPEGFHKDLEVVQKDPTHGTINFVPPKCGPYRLQVTAGAQEIPQSPADITIYDPTLGVPSLEPEISAEVEEVDILESLPSAELSTNLPELSIDASVGDEDSLDAWIKAPNGKILPCSVDKQGDKYKLSFLPFVVGPHQAHISVGDKPIKGSPFQINVTQQQAVSSEGPEVVLMGVGNPLEWKIEGFDGKGKLKVSVVGPKKCKAALKKNADKSHSIVLTPTYPGTYLVHLTDGGKPIRGSPFVVKVTNPKNVKLSGPGVKKLGGNIISGLLSLGGLKFPSVLPFPDNVQWTADLSKAALFTSDLKASITGPEGFHKDLEVVQKDPTHGTINFVPPKCGPYRLQVTAGAHEIPQSPADITIYDPTLGVPSFEPEISAEVEEVELLESLPSAELSTNLPELSIDASVGDEDSLDAWIKAPNGKILPCNVDKQGDKYKLSFLPFVVGPHQAHISVGDKPIKGSPFQINVTQQQAVSSEGPEVVLMGVGNPLEWKIEGFDGKGKLKVNVVGPKKCKAALKKNADKSHSIVLTPTYPATYLVHVTDGGKPICGSPFVVKVTNPKNVKLSGPGVKKLGGNIISGLLSLGGLKFPSVLPFPDNVQWTADLSKAALFTSDLKASITGPEGFHKDLEVVQKDPTHGTINFVPPKCGPYRLQVTAGAQEIPQSPADITIYDPTLGVPSFEPEISAEVEEVELLESLPPAELSANLPELSIDASVGDEDSLDAWIKAPNGKILPCNVDKQGDKYKLSFLPFVVGPHQAHISVGDKPIKGSPFQINVTQQQAVSSEGPEVVLMGVGNPLEWKIGGFDGKGKLKVNVVGPKKCKAALKKNADKSHSIVLTPTYPGTYLVHVTDGGKPICGSPFVVKVTNPKNVKLSGPGVKKLGGNIISGLLSLGGVKFPSVLPFPDNVQWTADLSKAALFTSDLKASITGPEGFHKDLEVVQKDPTHGTINFVPPKCGPYRLQVTAGAQEIPQSPADITIYDPTLGVPSFEPEISAEVEEVELLESLPPAELSANLPELSIDASVGDEDSLDAWIKAPNGKILPCNVDKQGDKYKLSFLPFVVGPHQAHISVGDKPIKGSPFQINVTQQQAVSSEGPEVVLMGVGNPLEWKIGGFDGKGKLKVNVVGPKKCKAALKKNADKSHSIVLTPTYPGTYLVHVTDSGKPIRGSPFVVKVTNPKNVKLSGPGVKKPGPNVLSDLLSLGGLKMPGVLPFTDSLQWSIDLTKAALFTSDVKAVISGPEGLHRDLTVVQKDPTHCVISFAPLKCGPYKLQVSAGGHEIPQSPVDVSLFDAGRIAVSGPAGKRGHVEQPVVFNIDASQAGEGSLSLKLDGPSSVTPTCNSEKQGHFVLSFVPPKVGVYSLNAKYYDQLVPGSPFSISVINRSSVTAMGAGVTGIGASVGTPADVIVDTSEAGSAAVNAIVKNPAGEITNINLVPTAQGLLRGEYTPLQEGNYQVDVTFDNEPIDESPFNFNLSNSIDASVEEAVPPTDFVSSLPELTFDASVGDDDVLDAWVKAPSGKSLPCNVEKQSGDKYKLSFIPYTVGTHHAHISVGDKPVKGSPFQINVTQQQAVTIEGPELVLMGVGQPLEWQTREPLDSKSKLKVIVDGPKKHKVKTKKNADKTNTIVLTPSLPGTYLVRITHGGKSVRGSPFVVKVCNPRGVKLSGPGIKKGGLADLLLSGIKTSGGQNRTELLPISERLEWSANLASSGLFCADLKATMYGAEGYQKELEIVQVDPTHSTISFSPPKCGPYKLQVTAASQAIPQSPVDISLYDASRISVSGPGLDIGCVGKPVLINIDATQAGEGSLSLKLDGPANVLPTCTSEKQGSFLLKFEPPKAGVYKLYAKFYDQSIPGSPFTINVSDPLAGPESINISGVGREGGILSGKVAFNVKLPAGFDEKLLTVNAIGPNAVCDVTRSSDNHGSLLFEYTPTLAGPYNFDVIYDGKHVTGSPFEAIWLRPPPDASKCHVVGIEKHGKFMVDCRNGGGNGFLEIAVFGAYCPAENINVQHNGDYTFDITYKIFRPGKTTISVKWHNVHLVGSPFTVITV